MIPTNNTIPYTATPRATWALIGLCIAAFLYQLTLSQADLQAFIDTYALVPARYTDGSWAAAHEASRANLLPFVTNMFLHGGFMHIASNLWVLWVFGPALEDRLGSERFLALYVASGVAASVLHFVFNFSSAVPALGASGAIAGVIAAYARRFPYAWVNVLQPVVFLPVFFMMPALLFAGFWFASQIMQGLGSLAMPAGGGIAWWAHIGGFVAGWFLVRRLAPPANPAEETRAAAQSALWPWTTWMRWMTWWWRR